MHTAGDPQVVSLAVRTAAFGEQVNRDSDKIRTIRRDLDALWVTRPASGGVVWVLRQRRDEPRRSA